MFGFCLTLPPLLDGTAQPASQIPTFIKCWEGHFDPGPDFHFISLYFMAVGLTGTLKFHDIEVTPLYTKFRKFLGLRKFSPCYIGNTFEHKIFGIFVWVQIIIESCLQTTHRNISWSLLLYEI